MSALKNLFFSDLDIDDVYHMPRGRHSINMSIHTNIPYRDMMTWNLSAYVTYVTRDHRVRNNHVQETISTNLDVQTILR